MHPFSFSPNMSGSIENGGGFQPLRSTPDDRDFPPIDPVFFEEAAQAYERIMAAIDNNMEPSTEDIQLVERLVKEYPEEEPSPEERRTQDIFDAMKRKDLLGCAKKLQELLSSLPQHFSSLSHFSGIKSAPQIVRDSFLQEEDVRAMGKIGEELASVGIRPSDLMESIRGVMLLCNRILRPEYKSPHLQEDGSIRLRRELMLCGIRCSHINPEAFEPICQWLIDVLRLRPTLIDGFHAGVVTDAEIILRPIAGPNK